MHPHQVVVEGEAGDFFYIIKEGEAVVTQAAPGGRRVKVNHLFRADFFGERALLVQEPRIATVGGLCALLRLRAHGLMMRGGSSWCMPDKHVHHGSPCAYVPGVPRTPASFVRSTHKRTGALTG
jgi:hypothetical protein